jgi:hypothetical protein
LHSDVLCFVFVAAFGEYGARSLPASLDHCLLLARCKICQPEVELGLCRTVAVPDLVVQVECLAAATDRLLDSAE